MARVLLLFFVVLTQGFCLLLMDSEYNYAAKKDDKPAFRSSKWVLKCPTWSLKEHLKIIEREAALGFCPKDEDEDLIEAHSPTAPLDGLNDVLRQIKVNPPPFQPEVIKDQEPPAPAGDIINDPAATEERYIVKAVPMTAHKEELISEELEKADFHQEENGDSSTNETIDQDEEPKLEDVKDSEVEDDPESAIPSTTPPPPPSANEAEIPSFREWTQKALEEEQKKREEEKRKKEDEKKKLLLINNAEGGKGSKEFNKTNGVLGGFTKDNVASTVSGGLKKNFASLDCGAKIAAANAESASASNIFTTSRDEYMRNACSDKAWFIVELCESIKALKIEIANHELYSSVFKDFRVSLSNVFPGRDKDWTLFGTFEAKDERFSQAFVSDSDHGVFGKYVKVEILSHHGNEYFCPISSFKIYGVSEIELIGADDDDDDDDDNIDETHFHHVSPQPTSESTAGQDDSMVLNVIKATFRIIAGVFAPNEQVKNLDMRQALNQSSLEGFTFLYEISCPSCDDNRLRDVYFLLAFNYAQLSHTLARNEGLKQALTRNVCQYYGFNVQEDHHRNWTKTTSIQSGFRMVEFYATLFGSSQIMALCNLISIASGSSPTVQSPIVLPSWKTRPAEASPIDHMNDTTSKTVERKISQEHDQKVPLMPPKETEAIIADPILSSKSLLPDASFSKSSSIVSKPVLTETVKTFAGDKQITVDSSVTSAIPSVTATISSSSPSSSPPPPSSASPSSASKLKIDPTPASPSQSSQEPLKDPPDVVIVPPTPIATNSDTNGQVNTGTSQVPTGSQSQGQRESVWQKLSNKIKSLERNVSLSSGYLEELSVQYKKQIDDLQLAVRQSGEALAAASKAREYDRNQVKDLKEEIGQLKVVVEEVSTRMETMSTWAVVVHSLFLVIEIFIGILFVFACWTRPRQPHLPAVTTRKLTSEPAQAASAPMSSSTPLKRRHSMQDKPLHDHHIQELNAVKHRRSSLDLTSRPVEGLSKRQKKRLQRRLSRANAILHEASDPLVNGGGGVCQLRDSSHSNGQPRLKLNNAFSLLNHSQHHDPESEALSNKGRLVGLLNGSNGSTRSVTPESRWSTPSHKAVRGRPSSSSSLKKSKKRSKSTSPARCLKNESLMSKRKDLIKNFDPDNVNWIQTTTTTMKT